MKVSVIMAAYNAEKYLEETLDSIMCQSLNDFEVIVVDDGSDDSTWSILRRYQAKYGNIKVIQKENGGPSSARNEGLKIAKGKYIYFIDSDDILEQNALKALYGRAEKMKADLVIAKYDIFNQYKTTKVSNLDTLVKTNSIGIYDRRILWTFSLWNKLYKRQVIIANNIWFPPEISYSEDGVFLMDFLGGCKTITGLDKVVLHYRKMIDRESQAITAQITLQKIENYILAHKMIYSNVEKFTLEKYPHYSNAQEAAVRIDYVHEHLNEILRKEITIMLTQFYPKFWSLDDQSIKLLIQRVREVLPQLDAKQCAYLQNSVFEFSLFDLPDSRQEVLNRALCTVVLFGEEEQEEKFVQCLSSLLCQNLIRLKIVLAQNSRTLVEKHEMMRGNLVFLPAKTELELFQQVYEEADTPYIMFANPSLTFSDDAVKQMVMEAEKSGQDFIAQMICHQKYGEPEPIAAHKAVCQELAGGRIENSTLALDQTLGNKLIRVDFLKKINYNPVAPLSETMQKFFQRGFYSIKSSKSIIFQGDDSEFAEWIATPETKDDIMKDFHSVKLESLRDPVLMRNPSILAKHCLNMPSKTKEEKYIVKLFSIMRKYLKVQNKVCFFSIRKDHNKLEGNTLALYPYVKGRKTIVSQRLPHNLTTTLRMYYELLTSKVIVTDDYIKYLRYFPLKEEQKVIQLWHACGAFKKFGRHGTNMPVNIDLATHAQYNLVCVSGEAICSIYADSFDLDYRKVRALGTPRTDIFFSEEKMGEIRSRVYEKHPELKDKFVMIYAPTFRDDGGNRTKFMPKLNFDSLSKSLSENQVFVICPHPIMEEKILTKEYPNIFELRDFSTNDLMFVSDMLITDYSSVIFEYALLSKPIAFFCYDLDTYNRGFYLEYPDDMPGEVFRTEKELIHYLTNPELHQITEKHRLFVQKYMTGCDGNSCVRIAELINTYMKGK